MQTIYAANIIVIASLAAAKASVTLLVVAISPNRKLRHACYATMGFVGLWTIASILALAFQCDLPNPWSSKGNKCVDQFSPQRRYSCIEYLQRPPHGPCSLLDDAESPCVDCQEVYRHRTFRLKISV